MYNIAKLYTYEKETFMNSSGKYNIHSLTTDGLSDYTGKDSYFVHKFLTGKKLDMLNKCSDSNDSNILVNNEEKKEKVEELNEVLFEENQPIEPKSKAIKLLTENDKNKDKEKPNKFYYSRGVSTRLYNINKNSLNQQTLEQLKEQKLKNLIKKEKENYFIYSKLPKLVNTSQKLNDNLNPKIEKVDSTGATKLKQSLHTIDSQTIKYAKCLNSMDNGSESQLNKNCIKSQFKIETEIKKQLDGDYCVRNNLPKISSLKNHSIVDVKIASPGKFMGVKYDPTNYQYNNFNKKKH